MLLQEFLSRCCKIVYRDPGISPGRNAGKYLKEPPGEIQGRVLRKMPEKTEGMVPETLEGIPSEV